MKSKNQGYVCYAANEINKSVLDSIEVGDLVKVNDWTKPMRVKFVAENGFAMTQKTLGTLTIQSFRRIHTKRK